MKFAERSGLPSLYWACKVKKGGGREGPDMFPIKQKKGGKIVVPDHRVVCLEFSGWLQRRVSLYRE